MKDVAAAEGVGRDASRRLRLWIEFLVLFVALPFLMAVAMPPSILWNVLAGMMVGGIALLALTPGFRWRTLWSWQLAENVWVIVVFAAVATAIIVGLVFWLVPSRFLSLPRNALDLWVRILWLYPVLSALPQEIFYRVLFFERYGTLIRGRGKALALNAACFALAHLFYQNWVALLLTAAGGAVFAWAYAERRSFGLAFILHTLAGQIIFTFGLGTFFYHGAIGSH